MSLTSRERGNPPPRRKSCAACIKAKRRCDAAIPACFRCSQRRITCEYPKPLSRQRRVGNQPLVLGQDGMLSDKESLCGSSASPGQYSEDPMGPERDAMVDNGFAGLFDFSWDTIPLVLTQSPSMLSPPAYNDLEFTSKRLRERLQYAIDVIRKAPSMMVSETQTPWCHPHLYQDAVPRSMQDAHASCALYMAKNQTNSLVILRSIESRVRDLLDAPSPLTPGESLAHTQSLILYQIIRLFDGDIGARASAERTIPALENSALALLSHVSFDNAITSTIEVLPYSLGPVKSFWKDWIFHESARRTLLLTFFFLQAYRLLSGHKNLGCDGRLGLVHSWTLSAHLWEARTPVTFAEVWRNKKHYVVTNAIFTQVLEEARADDIDDFGKIFISSLLGIDEAEGWFSTRGGSLHGGSHMPTAIY